MSKQRSRKKLTPQDKAKKAARDDRRHRAKKIWLNKTVVKEHVPFFLNPDRAKSKKTRAMQAFVENLPSQVANLTKKEGEDDQASELHNEE